MTCTSCNKNTGSSQRYVNNFQSYNPPRHTNAEFAQNPQPLTQWAMHGNQKMSYSNDVNTTNNRKEIENVYGISIHSKNGDEITSKQSKTKHKIR